MGTNPFIPGAALATVLAVQLVLQPRGRNKAGRKSKATQSKPCGVTVCVEHHYRVNTLGAPGGGPKPRRQTPAGLHYLPELVCVVEGPRDRWCVCEVSPLLGERARPAARLGRAVAGGVRVIKS